jgi:hypothetical protein
MDRAVASRIESGTMTAGIALFVLATIFVIPPGREAQLSDLFGGHERIAGCQWTGATIERTAAVGTFACDSAGSVRVRLTHPDPERHPTFRTAQFDATVEPDDPATRPFADALATRIRAHESSWEWSTPRRQSAASLHERVFPSRWIVGLACLALLLAARLRIASARTRRSTAPLLVVAMLATFVLRRFAVPPAWFHQNGQGPTWLVALDAPSRWSYGPGFGEVFQPVQWLAGANPAPTLFFEQGLWCAAAVGALWVATRLTGVATQIAWAVALVTAIEPTLARASGSESYFATTHALLALASATLALAAEFDAKPLQLAGAIGAACLAGEAARVHPYAFAAAPAVPAVLLAHRRFATLGRGRIAAIAVTFVATLLALEALATYHRIWQPSTSHWRARVGTLAQPVESAFAIALIALAALAARQRVRGIGFVAIAAIYGLVAWRSRLQLAHVHPAVDAAYAAMLATPVVPLVARGVSDLAGAANATRVAVGLAVISSIHVAIAWKPVTTLATDAREVELVEGWRQSLPAGGSIRFLSRAGNHTTTFPLRDASAVELIASTAGDRSSGDEVEASTHYLHSSVCSTDEGRATCDAIESHLRLEPVARASLPARPSQFDLPYDRGEVPIVLYRIVGGP